VATLTQYKHAAGDESGQTVGLHCQDGARAANAMIRQVATT